MRSFLSSRLLTSFTAIVASAFLVAGCGGSSDSPTGPTTQNIGGTWALQGTLSNASLAVTCNVVSTVDLFQSGTNFTGQVSNSSDQCTGPGGTASSTGGEDGALTGGQISGSSMSYADASCSYSGVITGAPTNRVHGPATCVFNINGTNYTFTGTWQLSR